MASGIYNQFRADLMNKNIDLEADDIKVILLDNNHTFSKTDSTLTDVNTNEISGTGYTTGGKSLSTLSVTQGDPTSFDAADVEWTSADFSAYHAVIYNNTTSNLIASIDFGGEEVVSSGTFKIEWNASGIITLS